MVYDIQFRVQYMHTVRVDASDEDDACEQADERVRTSVPGEASKLDVQLYGIDIPDQA